MIETTRHIAIFMAIVVAGFDRALSQAAQAKQVVSQPKPPTQSEKQQESLGQTFTALPQRLVDVFTNLDSWGRDKVGAARFVLLKFDRGEQLAWLLEESDDAVVVLQDDLIPWTYWRKKPTRLPSTWGVAEVTLRSVQAADFEALCRDLANPKKPEKDERAATVRAMYVPEPSYRALMAHAAWKKGLNKYCESVAMAEQGAPPEHRTFDAAVRDDLAWNHFLRGVNLLKFANRRDAVAQLKMAIAVAPASEFSKQSVDLVKALERLIAEDAKRAQEKPQPANESKLSDDERIALYITQLKDISCRQIMQPGHLSPYFAVLVSDSRGGSKPDDKLPSQKLRDLGDKAVPALIKALEDDTPTRSVYHWRDFARSRVVWRVSDFAWHILQDITENDLGNRAIVGFTFSYMEPEEKRQVIAEAKRWHEATRNKSPEERMMALLESDNERNWQTASDYFLARKDRRAVPVLVKHLTKNIETNFTAGKLCGVIAQFGDRSVTPTIREVLNKGVGASDRLEAAIALWELGDASGVPVAIDYIKAEPQPYGHWDTPVWFLMYSHRPEAIAALREMVVGASVDRVAEVLTHMAVAISGNLWGGKRKPAGNAQCAAVFLEGLKRGETTKYEVGTVRQRIKDKAAIALAVLKNGGDVFGPFVHVDKKTFNDAEPDPAKRDAQIADLRAWYEKHNGRLEWDQKIGKLRVKE
jgi:hypothetical protein